MHMFPAPELRPRDFSEMSPDKCLALPRYTPREDHIPNLVEEACVVKCEHLGSKVTSSSWSYDLSKQHSGLKCGEKLEHHPLLSESDRSGLLLKLFGTTLLHLTGSGLGKKKEW